MFSRVCCFCDSATAYGRRGAGPVSSRDFPPCRPRVLRIAHSSAARSFFTSRRFDQVDRRFDQVAGRFNQVDGRFDQVDGQIADLRREMLGHFDEIYRRLDRPALQSRIEDIEHRLGR